MKIMTAHEKMSYDIGYDIGHSDDITQANLLNGFCLPFKEHNFSSNMQMAYISKNLTKDSKDIIIELAEYCKDDQ
jgi:hypothetical protein